MEAAVLPRPVHAMSPNHSPRSACAGVHLFVAALDHSPGRLFLSFLEKRRSLGSTARRVRVGSTTRGCGGLPREPTRLIGCCGAITTMGDDHRCSGCLRVRGSGGGHGDVAIPVPIAPCAPTLDLNLDCPSAILAVPPAGPMPCRSSTPISVGRAITIKPGKENAVARLTRRSNNCTNSHSSARYKPSANQKPSATPRRTARPCRLAGAAPRSRGPPIAATSAWPPACAMPGCAKHVGHASNWTRARAPNPSECEFPVVMGPTQSRGWF
jgi:hypothetical protein